MSAARARRLALGAQGFADRAPASVGTRQLGLGIRRLGLLQIDSVNVYERSHYLPLFARLGAYDRSLLDRMTFRPADRRMRYFEHWGHAASISPIEDLPLFLHRMTGFVGSTSTRDWMAANRPMMDWLLAEIARTGPVAASDIEHEENVRTGPWWGWSAVKMGLEVLFRRGELFSAGRKGFERRYGLPDQVLPDGALRSGLPRAEAQRELVRRSVVHLGVGTLGDVRDYYRLPYLADATAALDDLVASGEVVEVEVEGWGERAYADPAARIPRRIDTVALLSPFDPVVWRRERALRMFGFDYRIEIYTPPAKRRYGYYTLPLLVDDALVGRIDIKSERRRRMLVVRSAWTEPGAPADVEDRIVPLLERIAEWQGLDGGIEVARRGDLAARLGDAVRSAR